mmetsp:Transcript_52443/g.78360  ORF Transcript_52443/g.78360 Transcript_52443/m.78360 type:complete len:92 (+) Transcript_52443:148-423(+)
MESLQDTRAQLVTHLLPQMASSYCTDNYLSVHHSTIVSSVICVTGWRIVFVVFVNMRDATKKPELEMSPVGGAGIMAEENVVKTRNATNLP